MTIESEVVVAATETGNEGEASSSTETVDTDTTESQAETPEAKYARLTRQAAQLAKKLGIEQEPKRSAKQSKSDELGYGEKAFLVANGIKGADEMALIQETMRETGRSLDSVIESRFIQGELKAMREARASDAAVPKGTKRSQNSNANDVDYWIARGELPEDNGTNTELRMKIVAEERRRASVSSPFTSSKLIIK
jgi:hypothetical protein